MALVVSASAFASTDPAQDPSSFYNLAVSRQTNGINEYLNETCVAGLRKTKHVSSPVVQKYLMLPSSYAGDETPDGIFYHYTFAEAVRTIAQNKTPVDIFSYLRQQGMKDPFLYVAGDTESSREFGNIQIRIGISTSSPIFVLTNPSLYGPREPDAKKFPEANQRWWTAYEEGREAIFKEIESDVIARYPKLKLCEGLPINVQGFRSFPLLFLLAVEDARVPLLAYYGTGKNWYGVMGTWAIDSIEVGEVSK